jgi:hypothetical protein
LHGVVDGLFHVAVIDDPALAITQNLAIRDIRA